MKIILTLSAFLFSHALVAQLESNHWFFGSNGGLNFSSGSPVSEPGSFISTSEGTSSVSDAVTGNLLFYTDGVTVFDATHNPMPNGNGLFGCFSCTQSALIVPQPGNNHIYYVFTNDCLENGGVLGSCYSVVDMTLNGGLGDVTTKNILLHSPCSEQLSAVKHNNCIDWWVMTKELNNNIYHAHLLTGTGVQPAVNSTIGLFIGITSYGQSKFSPDGTRYAISTGNNSIFGFKGISQLFDFDNTTGLLSNPLTLVDSVANEDTYGLGFSGDNSKLYVFRGSVAGELYQYDVSLGSGAAILGSATFIANLNSYAQLQLARNFKLYITNSSTSSTFSVINNPNITGLGCGLGVGTVPIAGSSFLSICNFPDSYFNELGPCSPGVNPPPTVVLHAAVKDSCGGKSTGMAWVNISGGTAPYTISWSPGGAVNDTLVDLPPGIYTVTVTDSAGHVVHKTINVDYTQHPCDIFIPNIITPNGDGTNDFFKIKGLPPQSALRIFNRWGNQVFVSEHYLNNWQGDTDGVYYYVLKTPDGRTFSGFVQVSGR